LAVVIDSSVIVEWERRDIDPIDVTPFVVNETSFITTVTVSELLVGVHRANTDARRIKRARFVEAVIQTFSVAGFGIDAARIYARLVADLGAIGRTVSAHDLMIASIALSLQCDVLTENVRHFDQVPGLSVRQPSW
jgi:tRNA(fMet)-specific endonuclease VapC